MQTVELFRGRMKIYSHSDFQRSKIGLYRASLFADKRAPSGEKALI